MHIHIVGYLRAHHPAVSGELCRAEQPSLVSQDWLARRPVSQGFDLAKGLQGANATPVQIHAFAASVVSCRPSECSKPSHAGRQRASPGRSLRPVPRPRWYACTSAWIMHDMCTCLLLPNYHLLPPLNVLERLPQLELFTSMSGRNTCRRHKLLAPVVGPAMGWQRQRHPAACSRSQSVRPLTQPCYINLTSEHHCGKQLCLGSLAADDCTLGACLTSCYAVTWT